MGETQISLGNFFPEIVADGNGGLTVAFDGTILDTNRIATWIDTIGSNGTLTSESRQGANDAVLNPRTIQAFGADLAPDLQGGLHKAVSIVNANSDGSSPVNYDTADASFAAQTNIRSGDLDIADFGDGFVVLQSVYDSGSGTYSLVKTVQRAGFDATPVVIAGNTTLQQQGRHNLAALTGGGYVAGWSDGSGISLRVYKPDGSQTGGNIAIGPVNGLIPKIGEVAATADGGFVVAYSDNGGSGVELQLFDQNGTKLGGPAYVPGSVQAFTSQFYVTVSPTSAGNFVVSWENNSGDVFAQVVSISGSAPVAVTSTGTTAATDHVPVVIDSGLALTDQDSATLSSATVSITSNFAAGQDVLGFTNQNGITGSYNAASGVLSLSGSSSVANYQAALRSVVYTDTSSAPSTATRTLSFVANDGALNSAAATKTVSVAASNVFNTAIESRTNVLNSVTGGHLFGTSASDFLIARATFPAGSSGPGTETLFGLSVTAGAKQIGAFGTDWVLDGTGDTNGDGRSDIFLHHDVGQNRDLYLATMGPNQISAVSKVGTVGVDFQVVGLGDFNHDGTKDILIQQDKAGKKTLDVLPIKNGAVQGVVTAAVLPSSWTVDAIGHLTTDANQDDILMHYDDAAGRHLESLKLVNGTTQSINNLGVIGTNYNIDGLGDFNGDGTQDILLHFDTANTRNVVVANIGNNAITSFSQGGAVGKNVKLDAIGDFNGDGTSDIGFHYDQNGTRTDGYLEIHNSAAGQVHTVGTTGQEWVVG